MKLKVLFIALAGSIIYFFLIDLFLMKFQGLTLFPK